MTYATRFDLLVASMLKATRRGRARFLATHRKLVRRGVNLPPVPPGHRIVAGKPVPIERRRGCPEC
ncbi:MAG TPA: hypothetical protein VJN62_02255 [Gemmatimonadales bacterium]|nr:hypothetical protein [Gemmatimonadales bacterium]